MAKTKVKRTRTFGARYGVSVRRTFNEVELKQRKLHECPACGFVKVHRVSTGIFNCKKCNRSFAGGAFYPQTMTGSIIAKIVAQKSFAATAMKLQSLEESRAKKSYEKDSPTKKPLTEEEKIDSLLNTGKETGETA